MDNSNIFARRTEQLAAFVAATDRWPSTSAHHSEERALGVWLNRQRAANRKDGLSTERVAFLDYRCRGWMGGVQENLFAARVEGLAAFVAANNAWPSKIRLF
ncbi:MAG: helicase associated domain-containing protein [Actinomycetota bacterium]|nr:helicase associated domain-containing protein [Actinomycetota bacterium]